MRKARPSPATVCALVCVAVGGCTQKPQVAVRSVAPDPVVARVNDAPIYRSDVAREAGVGEAANAPEPGTPAFAGLVDQIVDEQLLADKAVHDGLDRSAAGRRRLDAARRRVLSDMVLETTLRGAVTPEAVIGLYQEMEKAKPAGTPAETLEQARPRIVRFLTYDRVKDVVLDLRHGAKVEIAKQTASGAKP